MGEDTVARAVVVADVPVEDGPGRQLVDIRVLPLAGGGVVDAGDGWACGRATARVLVCALRACLLAARRLCGVVAERRACFFVREGGEDFVGDIDCRVDAVVGHVGVLLV